MPEVLPYLREDHVSLFEKFGWKLEQKDERGESEKTPNQRRQR
jgi:hypothetical protein